MKPAICTSISAFRTDPKQYQAAKDLLDAINETRRALGEGASSSAVAASSSAPESVARRWEIVSVSPHAMQPGTTAPGWATFGLVDVPQFQPSASLSGSLVLPTSYIRQGGLWPALRFGWGSAPTAGEVLDWSLSVMAAPRDGLVSGTYWSRTQTYTIETGDAGLNRVFPFPPVGLPTHAGGMVLVKVQRGAAATTVNPLFFGVDFAFQSSGVGVEERP